MGFLNSAARGKKIWLSELQGGRCGFGLDLASPARAQNQQYWIWTGIANQADAILFWNWRDEVFGKEASNFGIIGNDGFAEERLEAIQKTGALFKKYGKLLSGFSIDSPEVGVFFSPQSYFLYYANEGQSNKAMDALSAYCRALVCSNIPYIVIEEDHIEELNNIKILFLPRVDALSNETANSLCRFVENGGTIVCESECGAFDPHGIYRYPEQRFLAKLAGLVEQGRRILDSNHQRTDFLGESLDLALTQWFTPLENQEKQLLTSVKAGKGNVIYCNSYLGDTYMENVREANAENSKYRTGFERFVQLAANMAGSHSLVEKITPEKAAEIFFHIKVGKSGGKRMAFIFNDNWRKEVKIRLVPGIFKPGKVLEILSKTQVVINDKYECTLSESEWGIHILAEGVCNE